MNNHLNLDSTSSTDNSNSNSSTRGTTRSRGRKRLLSPEWEVFEHGKGGRGGGRRSSSSELVSLIDMKKDDEAQGGRVGGGQVEEEEEEEEGGGTLAAGFYQREHELQNHHTRRGGEAQESATPHTNTDRNAIVRNGGAVLSAAPPSSASPASPASSAVLVGKNAGQRQMAAMQLLPPSSKGTRDSETCCSISTRRRQRCLPRNHNSHRRHHHGKSAAGDTSSSSSSSSSPPPPSSRIGEIRGKKSQSFFSLYKQALYQIDLDMHRTFADVKSFQTKTSRRGMRYILQSFVIFRPDIGYSQGMSYLAAQLLKQTGSDPWRGFVLFANLICSSRLCQSLYAGKTVMNSKSIRRVELWKQMLHAFVPRELFETLEDHLHNIFTQWAITLFGQALGPGDCLDYIWSFFLSPHLRQHHDPGRRRGGGGGGGGAAEGLEEELAIYIIATALLRVLVRKHIEAKDYDMCLNTLLSQSRHSVELKDLQNSVTKVHQSFVIERPFGRQFTEKLRNLHRLDAEEERSKMRLSREGKGGGDEGESKETFSDFDSDYNAEDDIKTAGGRYG